MKQTVLLTVLIFVSGCVTTVTESDLRQIAQGQRANTLGQVDYLGRSKGYDYFSVGISNKGLFSTRHRISVPNNVVQEPQLLGSEPKNIRIHSMDGWLP